MITAKEVLEDVAGLIESKGLAAKVTGKVYPVSHRPRDSRLEDIIIIHTAGLAGQIQSGTVTINIYVPDVDTDTGVMAEDGYRCKKLERVAAEWAESLTTLVSAYRFSLPQVIHTASEPDIHQHFVVIKLNYEILDI
jgi:hypothetical protein